MHQLNAQYNIYMQLVNYIKFCLIKIPIYFPTLNYEQVRVKKKKIFF